MRNEGGGMRSGREGGYKFQGSGQLMVNGSGFTVKGHIRFRVQGEWFFSEAGFCFLKVWISVRIGADGGRQMVEVYFRPAA